MNRLFSTAPPASLWFINLLKKASTSRRIWWCLFPLALMSYVFFVGVVIRRWWLLRQRRGRSTRSRVIVIGNITVGGTGKTPLIALLLKKLSGTRVGVVSRGYGRRGRGLYVFEGAACESERSGDETALLARRFPNALFAVCENKWQAVQALDGLCETILLDDGLQRYDIPAESTIATVDCGCPDGYGWLLPRGLLREPYSWLARASCIVVTNPDDSLPYLLAAFAQPAVVTVPRLTRFFSTDGQTCTIPFDRPVALLSGIARPERFRHSMELFGYRILDHRILPDHGRISVEEARAWMEALYARYGDIAFVATEKDWARQEWPAGMLFSQMDFELISTSTCRCSTEHTTSSVLRLLVQNGPGSTP